MNWKTIALVGVLVTSLATIGAVSSALARWGWDTPYSTAASVDPAKIDEIRPRYAAEMGRSGAAGYAGRGGWNCRWHDDHARSRRASYAGRWEARGAGRCW